MSSNQVPGVGSGKQEDDGQANFYTAQTVTQLRKKIEELSAQQLELSEQREEVLVDRQIFVQSATRVREQLFRSANAATTLMNAFRRHYNELDASLPEELTRAYNALDEEKDKLGSLEVEHLEAEDNLGALEWKFTELENDLYQYDLQQLFPDEDVDSINVEPQEPKRTTMRAQDRIPVSTAIQYQVAFSEYNRLIHHYKTLREEIAGRLAYESNLDIDKAEFLEHANSGGQSFGDLLSQIAVFEVRLKSLKRQLAPHENTPGFKSRRLSEPAPQIEKSYVDSDIVSRAQSEGTITDIVEHVPTLHRVRDWLLDCLKQNALEKAQYLSILQQALAYIDNVGTNFTDWEDLATQQWPFDTIEPLEVMGTAVRPSTQDTVRIASMGEIQQSLEQGYTSTQQIDVENRHPYRDADPNLFSDLIIGEPPDEENHSRYSLTETNSIPESFVDTDEEFTIGQNYRSQSTQTLATTIIQEDTLSKTNGHSYPPPPGPKEAAIDIPGEKRAALGNLDEIVDLTVSEKFPLPAQSMIPRKLAGSHSHQDHLSVMEGSMLMSFEPRNMDDGYFFKRFMQTSLPLALPSIHPP
jgi:hypothetical protein